MRTIAETMQKSDTQGLWLLSSGYIPPNPAELLGSRRYRDLIASLEDHFDWAIIDTPPVLASPTPRSPPIPPRASCLCRGGQDEPTRRPRGCRALNAAKGHLIGAVLNNAAIDRHPYYYQGYYRKEYAKYYVRSEH
jgi:Mrp family chromosome partitioning ATPase